MSQFLDFSKGEIDEIFDEALSLVWKVLYHAHKHRPGKSPRNHSRKLLLDLFDKAFSFAAHRRADWSPEPMRGDSTLIEDVAAFSAYVARPDSLFAEPCNDIAAGIASCLMHLEGCGPVEEDSAEALEVMFGLIDVSLASPNHEIAAAIGNVLSASFTFTGDFQSHRMEAIGEWRYFTQGDDLHSTAERLVSVG